jgi:hypothetical protein
VIQQRITLHAEHIGYSVEALGETYQRKKQLVGRQVLVLRKAE